MSEFTKPLIVSPRSDSKTWVIMDEFSYDIDHLGSGNSITVPVGFITDFASVPWVLRGLIPRWGKHGKAAVIHDWLYWQQPDGFSRARADDIMNEAMRATGVSTLNRKLIIKGVKTFGFIAWRKNADAKKEGTLRVLTSEDLAQHGLPSRFRMASTIADNVKATIAVVTDKLKA